MNYDFRLSLMVGIDIPVPELQLIFHAPTIKDIAYMGEKQYFMAVQYLCLEKEQLVQDETLLLSMTNFQVLMKILEQTKDKDKKSAIITLLKLLFPDFSAAITKNSIILTMDDGPMILIDEQNFDTFQEVLREILCVNSLFQGENVIYNPGNDRAKEIANKLMKGRRKVAEQKAGNGNQSVLVRYISILTVAQIITLEDCINCNMFQLFDLMDRYTKKTEWDTDRQVKLAGGKTEKQVESWMKDIHPQ